MATNTLTSLAILKVNIDQGGDYLDYLRPFIYQVLYEHRPDPVTRENVCELVRRDFGLIIPGRTVEIVLKRICKEKFLTKEQGLYHIESTLPNPRLAAKQFKAERHISSIVQGLCRYSKETPKPINEPSSAVAAICAFLAEFDVACLRSYLVGTSIPEVDGEHADIVLVSKYVQHLQLEDPERFESFLVLVQGHMLSNALLCPDLQHNIPKTYKGVTFYFDTPLLLRALGFHGEVMKEAASELITLLINLGGKIAAFSHSIDELQGVFEGAASNLESPNARGGLILEARKRGISKSDLILASKKVEKLLEDIGINQERTPHYIEAFQIDEAKFEQILSDKVLYNNPRAKDCDINSVRSIYTLRKNISAPSIERSRAIFVTSNSAFARAAWQYGKEHEQTCDVSSVITDFTLANLAWLKAPIGAPNIPITRLLAVSYAALEPSKDLLDMYMKEVDKLEKQGDITERDHQLLRSSPRVYDELIDLTLGQDDFFTGGTVTQILQRVTHEIKREEHDKVLQERDKSLSEQKSHQQTKKDFLAQKRQHRDLIGRIYWQCQVRSKRWAGFLTALIVAAFAGAYIYVELGLNLTGFNDGLLKAAYVLLSLLMVANLLVGIPSKPIYSWIGEKLHVWFIKRQSDKLKVDISGFVPNSPDSAHTPSND